MKCTISRATLIALILLSGVTTHAVPARAQEGERCFGAVGAECGAQSGLTQVALCGPLKCAINGGSWEHDECCWKHRYVLKDGKSCVSAGPNQPPSAGEAQVCNSSWQKALSRTGGGWSWYRQVDMNKKNASGKVVFNSYCASKGARVHQGDVEYCCSKKAVKPSVPDVPSARICD